MVKRFIALVFLFVMGTDAFALVPQGYEYRMYLRYGTTGAWRSALGAACEDIRAKEDVQSPSYTWVTATCTWPTTGSATVLLNGTSKTGGSPFNGLDASGAIQRQGPSCPANSVASGGQCQCNSGFDESGGQCVPHVNQCTSRPPSIVNYTAGWQRTPSIGSSEKLIAPNTLAGGAGNMCVNGCTTEINVADACVDCKSAISQVPNDQGLYRVSVEFMGKATGTECTAGSGDAPATPDNSKDPPCPGYVGEINGVKGCYGTAAAPVSGVDWTQGKDLPKLPGNPPAGINNRQTPATGSGGSAGGPAGAAAGRPGGAGTGTVSGSGNGSGRVGTQEGTEQQACGAPGQPKCDVKVDETGTPTGITTTYDGAKGELDTNSTTATDAINAAHQIAVPSWSFSFQLPTGCAPFQVANFKGTQFTFNPCQYQGMIHDLLSMVWAAATAFCIIGMVGRTIRES